MPNLFLFLGFRLTDLLETDIVNHIQFFIKWNRGKILFLPSQEVSLGMEKYFCSGVKKKKSHLASLLECTWLQFGHIYQRVCTSLMPQSDAHVGNTWAKLSKMSYAKSLPTVYCYPSPGLTVPKQTSKALHSTSLQWPATRLTVIPLISLGLFKLNWLVLPGSNDKTTGALLAVLWQKYLPAEELHFLETLPARSERAQFSLPSLWAAYKRRQNTYKN